MGGGVSWEGKSRIRSPQSRVRGQTRFEWLQQPARLTNVHNGASARRPLGGRDHAGSAGATSSAPAPTAADRPPSRAETPERRDVSHVTQAANLAVRLSPSDRRALTIPRTAGARPLAPPGGLRALET